ncbi:MAG: sigma-70 family RNA polymerase sigma factor [Clostridia bacterium]|nr:sigma-70 family RNA polymerase sigma factor [Clostridia bacterium]
MEKTQVEKIITQHVRQIFGFALKRCKSVEDAEDLSQEIALKAFRALSLREDIKDVEPFLWTIARNTLANYYRDHSRYVGVSIDDAKTETFLSVDLEEDMLFHENVAELRKQIAYLSKQQREIVVAYYYENKKQKEIAEKMGISLSLVKWHLFEAKQNLKRGVENMKKTDTLQFAPIRFSLMGFNGSAGTMGGTQAFFYSALSQNIAYCVYREGKTVREIADALGVSPVYVESEAERLEEYGYLIRKGEKYWANFLIEEPDVRGGEILRLHEEMYEKAATLFANALCDELKNSGILEDPAIESAYRTDQNYLLWALIPYVAANCDDGEEGEIRFEEVATRRPDGAYDIANVTIKSDSEKDRKYYGSLLKWCGPSWTGNGDRMLWCCRSEWSAEKSMQEFWDYVSPKSIKLLCRMQNKEKLSIDEYTFLAQQGFIKMEGERPVLQIVWLKDEQIKNKLLSIGKSVKQTCKTELEKMKKTFVRAVLEVTPKHLRKMQAFGLQYIFRSDGWFLLYCIKELLGNKKLKLPTDGQKRSLMTIVTTI